MLLIDSLHGLFPDMTRSVPEEMKFRLYIETLSQIKGADGRYIRWADIRMLRRVVRDMQFRNYTPRSTIRHWHLVRRAELRYIVPELRHAHALVNSFLPYELPIMKARVEKHLAAHRGVRGGCRRGRTPTSGPCACSSLFDQLPAVRDESVVPHALSAARVHRRERVPLLRSSRSTVTAEASMNGMPVINPLMSSPLLWVVLAGFFVGAAASRATAQDPQQADPDKARTRKWVSACILLSVAVILGLLAVFVPGAAKIRDPRLLWAAGGAAVVAFAATRFKKALGIPIVVLLLAVIIVFGLFLQSIRAFTGETEIAAVKVLSSTSSSMKLELVPAGR